MTKTALVAGVRHYYAQGFYTFLGDGVACTPGVSGAVVSPVALNDVPASTCPSGQSPGTVNGVTKCYSSTGQPAAETVAASSVNTTYSKTTNADNTVTVTKTTTDTKTNTSTTSQTVYPNAAAVPSNLPVSESGVQTAQTGAGGMSEFCAVNPTASACVTVNPGTAAETGGLYTKDTSGKTFTSVVTAAKQTITSSAFYNATAGFFQVGTIAGSCSGLSTDVSLPWTVLHIDAGQYLCGTTADALYSLLAAAMLLLSLGVAFAIAIL
ncbi:MAG: hypothetical protein EG826_15595 [Deltaproteobacteria bacterium]|nr:hypothetical protein [Deltaproteobacteria bacterium]